MKVVNLYHTRLGLAYLDCAKPKRVWYNYNERKIFRKKFSFHTSPAKIEITWRNQAHQFFVEVSPLLDLSQDDQIQFAKNHPSVINSLAKHIKDSCCFNGRDKFEILLEIYTVNPDPDQKRNDAQNLDEAQAPLSFEAAFARLEEILEKLNTGTISLDDSLKLYEEADKLISTCNKRLTDAERKIEILVKNRNGELTIGNDGKPMTQEFKTMPNL